VELGVFAIQPLHTVRCVVRLDGERARRRLAHWQALARAACEQCGRNRVPDIYPLRSLDEWLAQPSQTQGILLSPTGEAVFSLVVKGMGQQAMTLLVGPEGGLSDEEETRAQLRGFIPAQLGQRILRCETAGLVAIAAAATIWGDF
ncbi:MAG: 16S rRNA (uracil(1498)-N(3))-methyltransferase, partial [Ottowia sp.]|nr:16S rRNA (uracil(1498)-N(3))-methyltransferase [Ottowia sp.]